MVFHQQVIIPLPSTTRYAQAMLFNYYWFCFRCFIFFFEIECSSLFCAVQSVDVVKYTEEEYEKYLTDPVGIYTWLYLLLF